MQTTPKQWQIAPGLTPEAEESLKEFPQPLRQILFNRGYADQTAALEFLSATPPINSDPENMLGVANAAARIALNSQMNLRSCRIVPNQQASRAAPSRTSPPMIRPTKT